ncbi:MULTISPECIES: branched-chain amino acid aminotransferase [unclassified Streptomyces]|uniref:branched-chain amino acid aminotransferase n=1 Tax=unclassified Streptomyces TaxID=2593676 RepID=UPI002DD83D46|nr:MULTISPECIES: branched-chain amino acid aminotransferase [unclassified Streptomyces]WSA92160.1 branched-chain amino acid aminotransferase [Streptomyces sp. NBC_01795]WSB76525.1 branched-chain amino acid aminotransferase [Streptomyces sp. NBC_01775]WSS15186.1 branched-chain amino acid aminotransferase [Streptomyces sp. NBC_01186]WSS44028.1 branched-chain amino acid aminotransferase [Streptomyces sp. NBC_01187]
MTTPRIEFDLKPAAQPMAAAEREAVLADPGFGRYFTDHMVTIQWTEGRGWHDAQLQPYAPLQMDPANMTLHYAQSIFEGLKAYRQPDGSVAVFRPDANARRFQRSAHRLAMPELPVETFIEACDLLVGQDKDWVPSEGEASLYLRPFMFASEVGLGVRPSNQYTFMVIASPAGSYFTGGVQPVSVWLSEEYVRASPGGTGEAKCAGNYAASLVAQAEAAAQGCDQVVWLDAVERRYIEEMGGMNLYFVYGEGESARIVTPELTGTLLPGITRDSLLRIASDMGYTTQEARISTDDWRLGNADGSISEVFACGTAAVITPVGEAKSARAEWKVADGGAGEITMKLREALLAIQTGKAEDKHGWMHTLGS